MSRDDHELLNQYLELGQHRRSQGDGTGIGGSHHSGRLRGGLPDIRGALPAVLDSGVDGVSGLTAARAPRNGFRIRSGDLA